MTTVQNTIGFIGAGHMNGAIIGGLVAASSIAPKVIISSRGQDKLHSLCKRYSAQAAINNAELIANSHVVVLGVKPQNMQAVIEPLKKVFQERKPLVISVAAGIACKSLQSWLGGNVPLIRTMPNIPSVIQEGATGLYCGSDVSPEQRDHAESIFKTIGVTVWLENEEDIHKVTAVSGSGPAYFMLMIKSLTDAAKEAGLHYDSAFELALQTARGTAGMIAQSDKPIEQLIDEMLLPGGTTEQAIAALHRADFPTTIQTAFNAANNRSQQLAKELKS